MVFKKGQSGNPTGRPKGVPNPQAKLRKAIEKEMRNNAPAFEFHDDDKVPPGYEQFENLRLLGRVAWPRSKALTT